MAQMQIEKDSSYLLFAGSYTDFDILAHLPHNDKLGNGVYCLNFEDGNIRLLSQVPCVNPAVLHFDSRDSNTLYVLTEGIKQSGTIHTVRFSSEFANANNCNDIKIVTSLKETDDTDTRGESLCYLGMNAKHGVAINYWQGSVDVVKLGYDEETGSYGIDRDAGILQHIEHNDIATKVEGHENRRQVIHREDHWVNRQCGSHAHSSHFWKKWVFIPDLGDNSIYQYRYWENGKNNDSKTILEYECQIPLKEGCGPRHMRFHPNLNICYVSNELNSTVTVLKLDDAADVDDEDAEYSMKPRMEPIQYISTVCDNFKSSQKDAKNYVAEILISSNGRDIYVSNRGYDTIAHFRIDAKSGQIVEAPSGSEEHFISTHGQCPRHFAMSPNDKYLLVANQDTNSISVFERDLESGKLAYKTQFVDDRFGAPNFLLFYPVSNELMLSQKNKLKGGAENEKNDKKQLLQADANELQAPKACGGSTARDCVLL